jgi:purine nucleoside permease
MLTSVLLSLVLLTAGCASPVQADHRFAVRVLVLTMFDQETAPWLAHESLTRIIDVPHAGPVHCADYGLCVTTIGEGKVNAATSLSALLAAPALDLHTAYFLTAGIAGVSPQNATLGFAAWARWIVDWDLGHHLAPADAPGVPHGYLPYDDHQTNVFHLDDRLVEMAFTLTKDLPLADDAEAAADRAHYPGQASRRPYVAVCDTISGDDYWTGADYSQEAQYITDIWTKKAGRYCTSEMEDSATAAVLARHGLLNRYLDLRTGSDFDQPYPGQSATDVLTRFPGAGPAFDNAYRVGSTVAHHLAGRS